MRPLESVFGIRKGIAYPKAKEGDSKVNQRQRDARESIYVSPFVQKHNANAAYVVEQL